MLKALAFITLAGISGAQAADEYRAQNSYTCGDFCELRCDEPLCDDSNPCTLDLAIGGGGHYGGPPRACEHVARPPRTSCTINDSIEGLCLDGKCVDPSSDPVNCGDLNVRCNTTEMCVSGSCESLARGLSVTYFDRGAVIDADGLDNAALDELCTTVYESAVNFTRLENPDLSSFEVFFSKEDNPFGRDQNFTGINASVGDPGRSCFSGMFDGYIKAPVTNPTYDYEVSQVDDRLELLVKDKTLVAEKGDALKFLGPQSFQAGECVKISILFADAWDESEDSESKFRLVQTITGEPTDAELFQTKAACEVALPIKS